MNELGQIVILMIQQQTLTFINHAFEVEISEFMGLFMILSHFNVIINIHEYAN